jgi:hypothetical protein
VSEASVLAPPQKREARAPDVPTWVAGNARAVVLVKAQGYEGVTVSISAYLSTARVAG